MPRKKPAAPKVPLEEKPSEGVPSVVETSSQPAQETAPTTPQPPREPVKVNHYNLTELKNACDDCLKKHLSRPISFQEQHTHTDVRLGLGYASVIIGGGTVFYGWKTGFEPSKTIVTIGVAIYFLLTFLQTLYIWYVEKETVFVGKRKTLDKRILTERLTVASKTIKSNPTTPPQYSIDITYLHSSNGGKTIIKRGRETGQKEYSALFDSDGYLSMEALEQWVDGLVSKAMLS